MMSTDVTPEEYLAVLQLFARYAHAIDAGDGNTWAGCYTFDGEYISSTFGTSTGTRNLCAFAADHYQRWIAQGIQTRHWNNQHVLTKKGADEIHARTYVLLLGVAKAELPKALLQTVYDDVLVRTENGWRLRRRQSTADMLPDGATLGFSTWSDHRA